jgi:hypothetical protein
MAQYKRYGKRFDGPDPLKLSIASQLELAGDDWYFAFLANGLIELGADQDQISDRAQFILRRPCLYAWWDGLEIVFIGILFRPGLKRLKLWRGSPISRSVSIMALQKSETRYARRWREAAVRALQPKINLEKRFILI